jgi:mRNA interferase HigB
VRRLRVTAERRVREYAEAFPDASRSLLAFLTIVRNARWRSHQELRKTYPHADAVTVASGRVVTIFNIGGNKYRLVTAVHYNTQRLFVLRFLTHAEYTRNRWKDAL